MRVQCPECGKFIYLRSAPEDGRKITCMVCNTRFRPESDDDDDDDRPVWRRRGRREEEKPFPVLQVVGGLVAAVGAVIVLVVALIVILPSDKKDEPAANTDPAPQQGVAVQPAIPAAPRVNPDGQPGHPAQSGPNPLVPFGPGGTPPGPNPGGAAGPRTATAPGTNTAAGSPAPGAIQTRPPQPGPGTATTTRPPVKKFPPVTRPALVGAYADLFRTDIDIKPPTIRAASLKPTEPGQEPEVPTFHSLALARKDAKAVAPKSPKMKLDEVKRACAYIKVDAGELSGTGSGFLIATRGKVGLVATNHHVIEAAVGPRYGSGVAKVTAVFNSGQPDQREYRAEIVAHDPIADLAILKIDSQTPWPKPLNPYNAPPKLVEGTPIQFWGFPLGELLASGKKNPEITLGTGTVASLRHTDSGKLDRVQISGTMNPGNSGGPLVDNDGRLVGIAVSIINPKIGTGIGFAVPVNDLIALLEGKLLTTIFVPTGLEGGAAKFLVFVPVMDPMDRVETVFVRRWAGDGKPPPVVKDPLTGYKPFAMRSDGRANLPGVQEFPLKKYLTDSEDATGLGIALGEMTVPADAERVLIQVASQTFADPKGSRLTAASKPIGYTLKIADQPVGTDARPFADLANSPEALAGKVVVVKARVLAPPVTRESVQDFVVVGTDGKRPDRMRFLVSRELAAQFDEVEQKHQPLPVRLVCLVGKRGDDGFVPVRVARLDFIGRGGRIVRTIPEPSAPPDSLAALNRDPAKFAGKTLELKVSTVPVTPRIRESNEFAVVFPNHRAPRNVGFTISNSMKQRMIETLGKELRVNAIVPARVTVAVPTRPAPAGAKLAMTVTKIDFLDGDGKVITTVE